MFARISYTWELMGASWNVLKRTKGLLIFPLLSGIFCLLVVASFVYPLASSGAILAMDSDAPQSVKVGGAAVLFLFYFCCYFVITFFNVAIVAGAISRIAGGEPTIRGCLREAVKRVHLILGWALVQATVSIILKLIEARAKRVGRWITRWLGAAWALLTFMVVPVLVVEEKGPIDAFKESASLLKRNWGDQVVGNWSFGLIFFLLMIPGIAVMFFAIFLTASMRGSILPLVLVVAAIIYIIVLALIQSALQAIFQAAVYMHTQGVYGEGFPVRLLNGAMSQKD